MSHWNRNQIVSVMGWACQAPTWSCHGCQGDLGRPVVRETRNPEASPGQGNLLNLWVMLSWSTCQGNWRPGLALPGDSCTHAWAVLSCLRSSRALPRRTGRSSSLNDDLEPLQPQEGRVCRCICSRGHLRLLLPGPGPQAKAGGKALLQLVLFIYYYFVITINQCA